MHVAGQSEGNCEIDPDSRNRLVEEAALWRQTFSERTNADTALVTKFDFDAVPIIEWANRLQAASVTLPYHVGVAGPAKLQALSKFAAACDVGPSPSVLQKRARDVIRLVKLSELSGMLSALAEYTAGDPNGLIQPANSFPLGGIRAAAEYAQHVLDKGKVSAEKQGIRYG